MKKNNQEFSIKNIYEKIIYFFKTMSYARSILLIYLIITLMGSVLLWLPISKTGNVSWTPGITGIKSIKKGDISFIDSLFTAASAFSDTGLATHSTAVVYSKFGQAILAILILLGGIGFFALKVYIFNILFGRNLGFRNREALAAERGSIHIGISRDLIRVAVTVLFSIIVVFGFSLSIYFYFTDISDHTMAWGEHGANISLDKMLYENPYHNSEVAIRYGLFHTISAINNAGFDIMGNESLKPYYYEYSLQIIFILLFVIGGIGYPVIYDVFTYMRKKSLGQNFRFSLFTKLSMITYLIVVLFGLSTVFGFEIGANSKFWNSNKYGSHSNKAFALFFNTMSTRNAGFSTISMHDLSDATLVQYSILMFIGSAPSSTAGGIRTTTIAVIFLTLWAKLRGRQSVYAFRSRIPTETVNKSFTVFFISIVLVLLSALISISSYDVHGGNVQSLNGLTNTYPNMTLTELKNKPHYSFVEMIFESSSAFGTTGLSSGITPSLNIPSKISLILLMFIGQLGVSSSILIWGKKNSIDKHFQWLKKDLTIG